MLIQAVYIMLIPILILLVRYLFDNSIQWNSIHWILCAFSIRVRIWMAIGRSCVISKWNSIRKIKIRKIISSFNWIISAGWIMPIRNCARKPTEIYSILLTASPFIWRIDEMFHSQWFVYSIIRGRVSRDIDFKLNRLRLKGSHSNFLSFCHFFLWLSIMKRSFAA